MSRVVNNKKAYAQNPLKSSTPLGAALAYLGIEGSVPLFHGSQGCTAFALVLAVRHFKESIPLQTTAMNEAATILGGADNLQEALVNLQKKAQPRFIGVASTALVETRGEDYVGEIKRIRKQCEDLQNVAVAFASTPDFEGALEEGWSKATVAAIGELVPQERVSTEANRINILPGVHQTSGDLEELRDIIEAFSLEATILPDISGSLDGHVPDTYVLTSLGGTPLQEAVQMGTAVHTIAIGTHMAPAAEALRQRTGVPFTVLPSVTGLRSCDTLIDLLMTISGGRVPARVKRHRSQLLDAMLDSHFWIGGQNVAIAADPDLLGSMSHLLQTMGAKISIAISSTNRPEVLQNIPCEEVLVGDLGDMEAMAAIQRPQLLITHSHGRQASERLGIPLFRVGFPIFDRLGSQHLCSVGYRGTRDLLLRFANAFMEQAHHPTPSDWPKDVSQGATAKTTGFDVERSRSGV